MVATLEQNAWVQRVLAFEFSQEDTLPTDDGEPDGDPFLLAERLADARQSVQGLKKSLPEDAGALQATLARVAAEVADGAARAPESMNALEEEIGRAMSAARANAVRGSSRVPLAFRKLLIDWHAAQGIADQNIRALGDAYLDHPDVQNDPRYDDVVEAVMALPGMIPSFGDQLDSDINAILNDGGKTPGLVQQGLETVGSYRSRLAEAAVLTELETVAAKDTVGTFSILGPLIGAIDQIETQLKQLATA